MNFVIIGGDAAGMSAASKAKRKQPAINVTVLEKTDDVSYSACGMPYNIAEPDRTIEDLVVRSAAVFRKKQGINLLTGHRVDTIDLLGQRVTGKNVQGQPFSVAYDKLLIATGARPIVPDLPGFNLPGVLVLKSLADGRKIKGHLESQSVKKAVIIGMGSIALEMAEALRSRGLAVDMVKPRPAVLPWMAPEMAQVVVRTLQNNGVAVYPGHKVQCIDQTVDSKVNGALHVVCPDLKLDAHMVLVAIGITPNSEMAEKAGLALGIHKTIAVDKQLKTSDENIFAAGDCADAFSVITGQKIWIPLALQANRAGWAVADNICGKKVVMPGIAGTAVVKVFDLQLARTGLNAEQAKKAGFQPVEVVIKARSRAHAHPGADTIWTQMTADKPTGRLLGVCMVGREGVAHRINAPAVALHSKMTVDQFSRTDLAYAPPFGPTWDPMLTAANQLLKKL
jgi:NADPH-dependent 2,4-dienoyl-CoA reductase/sulfur reductase-like enzyme